MWRQGALLVASGALLAGCRAPDPKRDFTLAVLETYWAVDAPRGDQTYIAPVVRLQLTSRKEGPARAVEAQATFRQVGDEDKEWASAWKVVAGAGQPIPPKGEVIVELKSEGRYHTNGPPESMFAHELFKDAKAEVFIREGSSQWTKMAEVVVERRIGARGASFVPPVVTASPVP
jgi:hypothetical protein